jgi:hypothetical protein
VALIRLVQNAAIWARAVSKLGADAARVAVDGNAWVPPNRSTAATKSWTRVVPAGTLSLTGVSRTRFGPEPPGGTVTAAAPLLVTETRV